MNSESQGGGRDAPSGRPLIDVLFEDDMPDTLTTAEAAAALGLHVRVVQKLAAAGELTIARVVGRSFLLDARSVRRYTPRRPGRPRNPHAPHSRYRN
ncbi:MAG TPA: excisionase family DNA-binding protein [Gemmataceae bacterium]|nr:excisionase family DNA-binding protein [Gemmataceae bacterium]